MVHYPKHYLMSSIRLRCGQGEIAVRSVNRDDTMTGQRIELSTIAARKRLDIGRRISNRDLTGQRTINGGEGEVLINGHRHRIRGMDLVIAVGVERLNVADCQSQQIGARVGQSDVIAVGQFAGGRDERLILGDGEREMTVAVRVNRVDANGGQRGNLAC